MGEKKRAHALLSASSAKKWLNCTPSARLEETIPDSTSVNAEEGTLAHSICELKLRRLFTEQGMTSQTYNRRMNKLKKNELYQPEMDKHTDTYVEYIQQLAYSFPAAPTIAVEKEVSYGGGMLRKDLEQRTVSLYQERNAMSLISSMVRGFRCTQKKTGSYPCMPSGHWKRTE